MMIKSPKKSSISRKSIKKTKWVRLFISFAISSTLSFSKILENLNLNILVIKDQQHPDFFSALVGFNWAPPCFWFLSAALAFGLPWTFDLISFDKVVKAF